MRQAGIQPDVIAYTAVMKVWNFYLLVLHLTFVDYLLGTPGIGKKKLHHRKCTLTDVKSFVSYNVCIY